MAASRFVRLVLCFVAVQFLSLPADCQPLNCTVYDTYDYINASVCSSVTDRTLHMTYPVERWQSAKQLALTAANLISTLHEDGYPDGKPPHPPVRNFTVLTLRNMMEGSDGLVSAKVVYKQQLEGEKSGGIYKNKFKVMSQQQVEDLQNHTFTVGEYTHTQHTKKTLWTIHNGTLTLRYNASTIAGQTRPISRAVVQDSDGFWTFPYHDCWIIGNWVVSYIVPILKAATDTHQQYHVMGEVYVDIKLEDLDINQCSHANTSNDEFANTHHCHPTSTCSPVSGKGFKLGSYNCKCKPGYYRPNKSETEQYFSGEKIELHYRSVCQNATSWDVNKFKCLPCQPGCGNCTSGEGCLFDWNFPMRTALLVLNCLMMTIPIALIVFVFRNRNVRIIRSASFRFLIVILIAVELLFANIIVKYFKPTSVSCSLIEWIEHTAFILLHGTLFLRVYRIVLIFTTHLSHLAMIEARMRDKDLLKKLILMITTIVLYLGVWGAVETPATTVVVADNGLKFDTCYRTWWHYAVGVFYVCLLAWGAYLGFKVRKVPSSYNESKLIFLLIYLVVVLYVFYIMIDLFVPFRDSPDISFIIDFLFCTLRNNLILFFLFANKVYATWKGEGDRDLVTYNKQTPNRSSFSSHSDSHRMSVTSRRPGSVSSSSVPLERYDNEGRHGGENGKM